MAVIGRVESLWRYPVKSMRGEELSEAFVGARGIRGDRVYAIHNSAAQKDFPYWTARQQGKMLLCRPVHRDLDDLTQLDIEAPEGERFPIESEAMIRSLREGARDEDQLSLLKSDCALTDAYPVSLISLQTVRQLSAELGATIDKRRFRANIYLDLASPHGFSEDQLLQKRLQIGPAVVIKVAERDVRCKMITLDPETARPDPEIMKLVSRAHEQRVGVYGDVIAEGAVQPGYPVLLLDA